MFDKAVLVEHVFVRYSLAAVQSKYFYDLYLLLLIRSTENMPLKNDGKGSYTATWVPAASGTYCIQVLIDGKHTGIVHIHVCTTCTCICCENSITALAA